MASGIMHMAIAVELIRQREFSDPDRLKFGSVLPDAGFNYRKIPALQRSVHSRRI